MSSAGDVNDDGVGDIIIGASGRGDPSQAGEAYVVYGAPSGFVTESPIRSPTGPQGDDNWWTNEKIEEIIPPSAFVIVVGLIGIAVYCFRHSIANHVLDHWGHKYKFIFDNNRYEPLEKKK